MTKMMEILKEFINDLKKENPYGLVMKGGTALAFHHLNMHRESEDLDFDARIELSENAEKIADHLCSILDKLKNDHLIDDYLVKKRGFASTSRYHINLRIFTYKTFFTKIDVEYTNITDDLEYEGALGYYSSERMFIGKLITFNSRGEFKDFYDIHHLMKIVDLDKIKERQDLLIEIDGVLNGSSDPNLVMEFKNAFKNADLRFKKVNSSNTQEFISKTRRDLMVIRNSIAKGIDPPIGGDL